VTNLSRQRTPGGPAAADEVERGDRPVEVPVEVFDGEETGGRWSGCRGRRGSGEGWGTGEGRRCLTRQSLEKSRGLVFILET
jgi:hypothetical protein